MWEGLCVNVWRRKICPHTAKMCLWLRALTTQIKTNNIPHECMWDYSGGVKAVHYKTRKAPHNSPFTMTTCWGVSAFFLSSAFRLPFMWRHAAPAVSQAPTLFSVVRDQNSTVLTGGQTGLQHDLQSPLHFPLSSSLLSVTHSNTHVYVSVYEQIVILFFLLFFGCWSKNNCLLHFKVKKTGPKCWWFSTHTFHLLPSISLPFVAIFICTAFVFIIMHVAKQF